MQRTIDLAIAQDLTRKLVFVTGPRQVGKTTLSRMLLAQQGGVYLNYDMAQGRLQIERQSWQPDAKLVVLDELHKMPQWKTWLKGVVDGKPVQQQILVTGSARMDTFRQTGDSLAGRFLSWRLHPISVREWVDCHASAAPLPLALQSAQSPSALAEAALHRLLLRGGFPEPFLLEHDADAARWRSKYADGLVREDIMEFSRLHEVGAMRVLLAMLRDRVGSPLSLASLGRDLQLSQPTIKRYLDILQALYIVFLVQPWHHNIARSLQQAPKVYFYDTGMVGTQDMDTLSDSERSVLMGARFENAVALALLKQAHHQQDAAGKAVDLHYLRTKDGTELDFALSNGQQLTHMLECKWADARPARAFASFSGAWPQAKCIQLVRHLAQAEHYKGVDILPAAAYLASLDA